jgi:hypothetical protein
MYMNDKNAAAGREALERRIAKILHRHCNFGWAHYYIPSEKFPSLIEELAALLAPHGEASSEDVVRCLLELRRVSSEQERADKLMKEFIMSRRS